MKALVLLIFVFVLATGCSQVDKSLIPSSPDNNPTPVSNMEGSSIGILGGFNLQLDQTGLDAELIPLRTSAIGESYTVSGAGFFTVKPCHDCLRIRGVGIDLDGNVVLKMQVKHPFQKGDPFKPPTGLNRLDLDVFDLAMIVVPKESTPDSYPLTDAALYPNVLSNPTGYTCELSSVVSDTAACPYVICYESENNNRFEMGTDYQQFDVSFKPSSQTVFDVYLTMGYGASAQKAQRLNPTYYVPEFNRKAAWKVVVVPPNGSNPPVMGNTWNDSDTTTLYTISIDIYDWNHGATISPTYPDPNNTNQIKSSSDIGLVTVEVPGMTSGVITAITSDTQSNGWDDPITYTASFANENALAEGTYNGLVKVTDTRIPGVVTVGGEPDTLVHTADGILLQWYAINEFATYQVFPATVVQGCGPVTGSITDPNCPISGITSGQSIQFTAQASSANGGDPIVLYEWDSDYDGINFSVDATGASAELGPFINPNCGTPPENPVNFTVAVRGTDSCDPPNVTVFATCEVTVDDCGVPPVGNVTLTVNRTAAGPGCVGYPISSTQPFTLSWTSPGAGIVEYAIYVDRVPSDGLTNNLLFVGSTATTTYDTPAGELPSNHYIQGYTYIVRSRAIAGDPSSESVNSQPAHVIVTGFETLPIWQTLNGEGWLANAQGTDSYYMYSPFVTGANRAQGAGAVQFSRYVGDPALTGLWNGMTYGPIPAVSMSSVRDLEFSAIWRNVLDGGFFIGTCSTKPGLGWASPQNEFDWSLATDGGGFLGYTGYDSNICTYFNGCPTSGNNSWRNTAFSYSFTMTKVKGDCNLYGDSSDQYIGMACLRTSIPDTSVSGNYSNIFLDDVSIAVY